MIETYKKYYFFKAETLEQLQKEFDPTKIVILDKSDPIAIIDHRLYPQSSHDHILTQEELEKFLEHSSQYIKQPQLILQKAKNLGKFAISKNEDLPRKLSIPFFLILLEIVFTILLISSPLFVDKRADLISLLLEIVGTTLTFFFNTALLEEDITYLVCEGYDKYKNSEIKWLNKFFSFLGLVLFVIGFILKLNSSLF